MKEQTTPAPTAKPEARKRPQLDPELAAMAKVDRVLGDLGASAKGRILTWAMHRHVPGTYLYVTDKEIPCG
jgi:hypothetical protein